MRLPNGFGSVYKLSGKRRNPWCARKTIGWNDDFENKKSYPIYKFVGYYPTKKEAIEGLSRYNENPLEIQDFTLEELYNLWSSKHFEKVSKSNINGVKASWKLCESIKHMNINDVKLMHLQHIIDTSNKNTPTLKKFKIMFGLMYDYAVINELATKDKRDMIRYLDIGKSNPNGYDRTPFTDSEIKTLWNNSDDECVMIILILLYTGLRIGELLELRKEDVNLDESYFNVTKSKTESGIRQVPIADVIKPIINHWFGKNSDYLICNSKLNKFEYSNYYRIYWKSIMERFGMTHKPHDARHTLISRLANNQIDERIIKSIVGHAGNGVTESVYTHITLQSKLDAINTLN